MAGRKNRTYREILESCKHYKEGADGGQRRTKAQLKRRKINKTARVSRRSNR